MVNQTIVEGLEPYRMGEKMRTLRLRKSMGLVELGKHTGLSPAMLSKLERGKLFPTLPTLLRIALVFGVGLEHFFADERKRHVVAIVRKKERLRFPEAPGSHPIAYSLREPRLQGRRSQAKRVLRRLRRRCAREDAAAPASRHRVAVRHLRQTGDHHRIRPARVVGGRRHLLRLWRSPWLPAH